MFGSVCYRHIPDQLRWKLDDKGKQLILLGYQITGGYKLQNPRNLQIVVSRDVVFDELKIWNWDEDVKNSRQVMFDLGEQQDNNPAEEPTNEVRDQQEQGTFHLGCRSMTCY